MTTTSNEETNGHVRRFRIDRRAGTTRVPGRERSGRVFIVLAALGLAVLFGALFAVFRQWRERYRALAQLGSSQVAPLVDPLAERTPPGVSPAQWRRAVADTHAMLAAVTAAGVLDREGIKLLRTELAIRVRRSRPETAVADLSNLWDEMEARAGPIVTRTTEKPPHPPVRPRLLPRRATAHQSLRPR